MILAIKVSNKQENACKLQQTLTRYNSCISTRVGFNEGDNGVIIINTKDTNGSQSKELQTNLESIDGVKVLPICF